MEAANAEMQWHARECDEQCRALEAQAAVFHERWRAAAAENERLQAELAKLRDEVAVRARVSRVGSGP
jgi:cell division protein FtsB